MTKRKSPKAPTKKAGRTGRNYNAGGQNPRAKLLLTQVRAIKKTLAAHKGERGIMVQLAETYGVTRQNISNIAVGRTWRHADVG